MAVRTEQSQVVGPIVSVVAVEVVDLQWDPAGHGMTSIPAAARALFTANFEQVPSDVAGYFADRSAIDLPIEPSLHKSAVFGGVLAPVAAELAAGPTDRLFANKASSALPHSSDARFHAELQAIGALVLVALLAILPWHALRAQIMT